MLLIGKNLRRMNGGIRGQIQSKSLARVPVIQVPTGGSHWMAIPTASIDPFAEADQFGSQLYEN